MAHDPIHDHIFGDLEGAQHENEPAPAPRKVLFAGVFGLHEAKLDTEFVAVRGIKPARST